MQNKQVGLRGICVRSEVLRMGAGGLNSLEGRGRQRWFPWRDLAAWADSKYQRTLELEDPMAVVPFPAWPLSFRELGLANQAV